MSSVALNKQSFYRYLKLGWKTWLLLFIQFATFFSFFMFIPLISTHLNQSLGYSAGFVGLVLAIRMLSQQGLMILGGVIADRYSYKIVSISGLILRGIGFIGMGLTSNAVLFVLMSILSGVGGALFTPALKAMIASLHSKDKQKEIFSLTNISENLGAVLGPSLLLIFDQNDFLWISCISGGIFCILGLLVSLLPNPNNLKKNQADTMELKIVLKDRKFIILVLCLISFHFIYQQLYLVIPLIANLITGSSNWIFPLISVIIVSCQMPIFRLIKDQKIHKSFSMAYMFLIVSLFPISFFTQTWSIIVVLFGIALGQMVLLPTLQSFIAVWAPKELISTYFGFSNIAMAIGGSLGNILGGILYDYWSSKSPQLFWLFLISLCLASICLLYKKRGLFEKE